MNIFHRIASVFAAIGLTLIVATIWTAHGSQAYDLPDKLGNTAGLFLFIAFALGLVGTEF